MLPSAILRSQARFQRYALRSGRPLSLAFSGPYTRLAADGSAIRPSLGTANVNGFSSFATLPSDLKEERIEKWGKSFSPDGYLEFSDWGFPSPAETLSSVTDLRSGEVWDVIYVLPAAFLEERCRALLLRRTPVYNRYVSVSVDNPTDNTSALVMSGLPCRITPQDSGLGDMDSDVPGAVTGAYVLECPYVLAGVGDVGAGITPQAAGRAIFFDPKGTVITDDPSVYGGVGPVQKWRIASLPEDAGGDQHHLKYAVTLK